MRKVLALLFLLAPALFAQTRGRAVSQPRPDVNASGNTVTGIVSAVQGPFILLANGLVTIDTTGAQIVGESGAIAPGSLVFAVLKPGSVAPNAPLPAQYVGVTKLPQVSLIGTVTAVDLTNSTLTILGRTIKVTPQTVFSSWVMTFRALTLSDIQPNDLVQVDANASGGALVANSIHVLSPIPSTSVAIIHGTVKSITNDAWVIATKERDVSVVINAQTKIAGDPKVGDIVDVVTTVDTANRTIAVLITRSAIVTPPPTQIHLSGIVKSIGSTSWTISPGPAGSLAPDVLVQVTAQTKINGNPHVGDRVEVLAEIQKSGFVAVSITRI